MSETIPDLQAENESLRAESCRQAIEAEEALHELTNKLAILESQLKEAKTSAAISKQKEIAESEKVREIENLLLKEKNDNNSVITASIEAKKKQGELERTTRDLMETCARAGEEKTILEDSLATLRELHASLQTSHSSLESKLQESATTSRTSLLRLQTLSSTITSLEADKSFLTTELERGRLEWAEYRRENHAELVRLQTELENHEIEEANAKASLASLTLSNNTLTNRHLDAVQTLSKVREELATSQNNFTNEMGSMKRLVEMMETREVERVSRVEEIERELEVERSGRVDREVELLEDLRIEKERCDLLELRCSELRDAIERGAGNHLGLQPQDDELGSPSMRGAFTLSPSAQMAVKSQKSGRSYAEVYGEYIRMQEELLKEKAESARLGDCLVQIMGDIEERAPLLKEQRIEYDRLSIEYAQIVAQLSDALADREESDRHAEASKLDIDRLQRDNAVLGNQLRDLGRQVRSLMRAIASSEISGINERSAQEENDEEEEEIKRRAEISNDTDTVVSAHLVTFRTINDLQVQNQKLLRITREMGAQMERAEEDTSTRRRVLENDAVEEAHELILKLKEEVENQRNNYEVVLRERDMVKRMLSQRNGGENLGSSNGFDNESNDDASRLLAETQSTFEAYKTEITVHSERLRQDLAQAQRDANNARTELAKQKAHAEFTAERFQLLNSSYAQQTLELTQASKRTLQLQQNMAKQDSLTFKNSEELLTLRSSVDRLRHENTNFKSEQQVWKTVENRLIEENTALSRERSHLADLMGNLQTMQNELERAGTESRRRLEDQVTRLDQQVADLREKLSDETDASRQIALRKEFDARSYQDRLDTLTSNYQHARESLLVAKTSQEHLEQRVSDLLNQIGAKEERLAIYEGGSSLDGLNSSQSREQQLEVAVADLRSELRSTKSDLERATAHVEQYQAIAETQGESLRQLTATYDEYKSSTDAAVAAKDIEISGIRERLHSLTSEITAGQNVNSELHRQIEEERRTIEKERKSYEDVLADLRSADVAAREAQLAAQEDSRRQTQLAKEASEKYQREVVDHGEDVKHFTVVSEELESIRKTIRDYQLAQEVATANLVASESSWNRQKIALEQEINDFKKRCVDLAGQNAVLHDHLEKVGNQARLQSQRTDDGIGAEESTVSVPDDDQLKEVIRYLRREKDIGDLQLEFTKQELARVRQQHEYTSQTLEEVRKSLTEQRQKSQESSSSSAQHAELLERIHTAKILRESNQTLRDENENNSRKLTQVNTRLQDVLAELEPLKERAQILQAEVDAKEHNIKLLQEDNERWKVRNQTILAKYERIDPEELQVLKTKVIESKSQLEQTQVQIKSLEDAVSQQTKVAESMKQNWTNSQERFKSLQTQARTTRDEKTALAKELAELKLKLETGALLPANNVAQEETARLLTRIASLEQEKIALEARLEQQSARILELEQQVASISLEKSEFVTANEAEKQLLIGRNDRLLKDNKKFILENKEHVAQKKFILENKEHVANIAKLTQEKETIQALPVNSSTTTTASDSTLVSEPTTITTDQLSIDETVRLRVAAMESSLAAERDAEIATAITTATVQLQSEISTLREALAVAQTSSTSGEADSIKFETAKKELELKFEKEKKDLVEKFEAEKAQLQAQAKAKELALTQRLTAEITKASLLAAANSSTSSPPIDIDSLVQAKLVAIDAERSIAQRKAIEVAVAEISSRKDIEHETALTLAKEQLVTEATMKHKLLLAKVSKLEAGAKVQKAQLASATSTSSSIPTLIPTSASTISNPLPLPPLVSTVNSTIGGNVRGQPSRRGSVSGLPGIRGGVAGLALKGVAAARGRGANRGGGGVLASISGTSQEVGNSSVPKRGREEGEASAGPAGDLSKRMKGAEEQKK